MSAINKDTELVVFRIGAYIYIKAREPKEYHDFIFRGTIKEIKKNLKRLEKEADLFGCTPNSLKLLKSYRWEYKYIKAIIKENKNVGS